MSRIAAPDGEVTKPIDLGHFGKSRFLSTSNRPSLNSFSFNLSKRSCRAPLPSGSRVSMINCYSPRAV